MTLSMLVSTVNMDAGIVKGRVYDSATNEPLIGATVIAGNHTQGGIDRYRRSLYIAAHRREI